MTELATYQPSHIESYQDAAVHRLSEWAQSADAAYKVAGRLVESAFVPVQFRGKPIEATAAILAGIEVGLSPMSALRAFDIIQGQATARAITLRAIVQSQGHEMLVVESTETRCVMRGRRKGSAEWQTVRWTLDRAKNLGLLGKSNWKSQPGTMLIARATSELARLVASDAILGLAYSSEEVADGGAYDDPASAPTTGEAQTGTRRMSRIRPVEDAPLPEPAPPADEPAEVAELITGAQSKKLHALYRDNGLEDRAERLAHAAAFVGHDLASSAELTKDEASRLIDNLESLNQAADDNDPGPDPWSTEAGQP